MRSQHVRFSWADMADEAVQSLHDRRGRTVLTALGSLLGVGALVSVLGLTSTVSAQIDSRFNATTATEVVVNQRPDPVRVRGLAFPTDAESRMQALPGVRSASVVWTVDPARVSRLGRTTSGSAAANATPVVAAGSGVFREVGARFAAGKAFDRYAIRTHERTTVLGPVAARALGISSLVGGPSIYLGGVPFSVIGILRNTSRHSDLLASIIVPRTTAQATWGDPSPEYPASLWISVNAGATRVVADEAAVALTATQPGKFATVPPLDPTSLHHRVSSDLNRLFILLGTICLLVGSLGIANASFVSVMERIGEIGLRRAMGARRRHIAAQFLMEAGMTGLAGGVLGTLAGLVSVIVIAWARQWTAVFPLQLFVVGPLMGVVTGMVAGAYPAARAARIEPVEALRHGT